MKDTERDINIPTRHGWRVVTVPEFEEYRKIDSTIRMYLDAAKRYIDSERTVLFCKGGSIDQPRKFWEIVAIADRLKVIYHNKDLEGKGNG